MKKSLRVLSLLLVVAMLFGLAACAKKEDPKPVEDPKPQVDPNAPVYGGTLILSREGAMTEQDWYPHMKLNNTARSLTMNPALEQLFYFDKDGKMLPQLAKSWDVSDDSLVWTFHLVENATFHDGTKFDADAVVWNLNAAKEAAPDATTSNGDMATAEKVDDYTVKVTFSSMYATLLLNFDSYMYSPTAFEKNGLEWAAKNPVGTGAFKFDHLTIDSELVYVKNENYWGVDKDGNKLPYLDGVTFKVIANETVLGASYQAGEVDIITNVNSADLTDTLLSVPDSTRLAVDGITIIHNLMTSANVSPELADANVRKALAYAIDWDTIIESLCDTEIYHSTNQIALPGSSFYDNSIKGYAYDKAKAIDLLKAAGYGEGGKKLKLTLVCENIPTFVKIDQAVQAQLIEVGVDCELMPLEGAAFLEKVILNPWGENWLVDQAVTVTAYSPITGVARLMGANASKFFPAVGWTDEYKNKIGEAAAMPTLDAAAKPYKEGAKILVDDECTILGFWTIGASAYEKNNIHGYTLDNQTPQFAVVWKSAK